MKATVKDEYYLDAERAERLIKLSYSATNVAVVGPSGNGKSTWNSYILRPESNKILGQNIGDVSQSSLIETKLSLTEKLGENDVCIQFIRREDLVNYQDVIVDVLGEVCKEAYDNEVDNAEVGENEVRKILDPINKSYHAYRYAHDNNLDIEKLKKILTGIVDGILKGEVPFNEAVNNSFQEKKKKGSKVTKKEVLKDVVEECFYQEVDHIVELKNWFQNLQETLLDNLKPYWSIPSIYLIYGNLECVSKIGKLVAMAYDKDSVFSLVFKQMIYVVRPSEEFLQAYRMIYQEDFADKPLHLNILDTVGLTHISDRKEDIEQAVGTVMKNPVDAVLFLCASDEKDTVFRDCLHVFSEIERIGELPFTICRTKADTVIRNKRVNLYRKDTGNNEIPDKVIAEYTKKAIQEFKNDFLAPENFQFGENWLGNNDNNYNQAIEFISLAPDLTKDINTVLKDPLGPERSFRILLNLSLAADKAYTIGKLVKIQGQNADTPAVFVKFQKQKLYDLIDHMVSMNEKHSQNQYLKYIGGNYHGRSITTYLGKLQNGYGHETDARVYDNFKLHVCSMIKTWLAQYLRTNPSYFQELTHLDYSNTFSIDGIENNAEGEARLTATYTDLIGRREGRIRDEIAKKTSYEFLSKELWDCYEWSSWRVGFEQNLKLFYKKFSDQEYWRKFIKTVLHDETERIIHKLCIILDE
jgi:energy-coupling factor transporter ATP-binding protein EcfA2